MADPTIEEVDAYIAAHKSLLGYLSEWQQHHGWDWTARWGVVDALQVQEGELVFSINPMLTKPSITMLLKRKPIFRVDIVPFDECKPNAYAGRNVSGLPGLVCGPHVHSWADNRDFIAANGFGELPIRRPINVDDTKFIRALEVASHDLNIHVTPAQRACEPPKQASLFADRLR